MDNAFLVGLSAQQVLQQRMDITANNLANMTSSGFKTERLVAREISEKPAAATDSPKDIEFVGAWMVQRDFSTGSIEQTGNPLDVAIEGEGFFVVQTPAGPAYTRDGRFTMNSNGEIVTRSGHVVTGSGGAIVINPEAGPIAIGKNGSITQDGQTIGKFDVVAFEHPGGLEKMGDNLWKATDEAPREPEALSIAGGAVESSNVNAVSEITQMIEISRTYQSVSKMIDQADELRAASIDKLSRVG